MGQLHGEARRTATTRPARQPRRGGREPGLSGPLLSICHRADYPTDQVGLRWPVYWGADGHDRIRYAPTRFTLQRLDGNTLYDVRVAMCTELEDSSTRGLQVCAAVDDYSSKRTIRTVQ